MNNKKKLKSAFIGIIIAIWAGLIGLKIAGTGLTLFAMAFAIHWIYRNVINKSNDNIPRRN